MGITYIVYTVAALALALILAFRTDRKYLGFVLTFWILAQPVLEFGFTIHLPGFDLTPNRVLLLVLLAYFLFSTLTGAKAAKNRNAPNPRVPFEKYLYIYLALVVLSLAFNFGKIRPQDIIVVPLHIATFIVAYLVTKKFATQKVLEAIITAVIVLTVVGAAISFIQFGVDNAFLRTGDVRIAFGQATRATGIFSQEYDFGAVQAMGLMTAFIRFRGTIMAYILVPILALSVVLTFHRLDILIVFVCLGTYFLFFTDAARKAVTAAMLVFGAIVMAAALPLIGMVLQKSTVVTTLEGRIGQDTVTGRLAQYEVAAKHIFTDYTLLGMGTYENPAYDELMKEHGMVHYDEDGRTLIGFRLHNGYLEVGILRGVLAMFVFTAFLVSMLRYFTKRNFRGARYSSLPVFVVLIYMLINLSNGMSSFNFYIAVLCALLTGSFVVYHIRNAQVAESASGETGEKRRVLATARTGRAGGRIAGAPQLTR